MREDWIEVKLGDVCTKAEKVKRKEVDLSASFIYLDISGINNKTNQIVDHKIYTWTDAPSRAQQIVKYGDTLFSTVRTYLKNIAQVTKEKYDNQICSSGFTVIRGKENILNAKFVFYLSIYEGFLQPLNELQTGTSYPAVRDSDVFSQVIPLAPLPEQIAIAKKIEQLFSELDNGISNLKTAKAKLEIYRQAVLKKAFEGELTKEWRDQQNNLLAVDELLGQIKKERTNYYETEIKEWNKAILEWEANEKEEIKPTKPRKPEEPTKASSEQLNRMWTLPEFWTWTQLGCIAFVTKLAGFEYTKYVKYDESGDLAVIKAENASKKGFNYTNFSKIKSETVKHLKRSQIKGSELLVVFVGAGTGNVALVPQNSKFFLGPNISMVRPYFSVNTKYIEFFLRSSIGSNLLMTSVKAVAQPSLSMETIRQVPIVFPNLIEQHQIVQEIETRLSVCDKLTETIDQSLEQSQALRQSILKKAFEGNLLSPAELAACRQHPDWEPAAKLLEKIKKYDK